MAGPEAGHAFPAFALSERLSAAGHRPIVFTGARWERIAARRGIEVVDLPELAVAVGDDDDDAGAKLSVRAARMASALAPLLTERGIEVVVADVITVAGGWAAELAGLPWVELSPHPLYTQSRGLPPIGAGLDRGRGWRGRGRDRLLRAAGAPARRRGRTQRRGARASIGLSSVTAEPIRLIATLPGLELYRPDWPAGAHLIGPLLWEPTDDALGVPAGSGPLIMVAPSTAVTGAAGLAETALTALAPQNFSLPVRVVISGLQTPSAQELAASQLPAVTAGLGRQDDLVAAADLVVCGGGHGMLVKALRAGVPVVTVPGGGDQWELANRVARLGAGVLVRPVTAPRLADAVRQVLESPEYAGAARHLACSGDAVVDPVDVIESVAAG